MASMHFCRHGQACEAGLGNLGARLLTCRSIKIAGANTSQDSQKTLPSIIADETVNMHHCPPEERVLRTVQGCRIVCSITSIPWPGIQCRGYPACHYIVYSLCHSDFLLTALKRL
jgi:hypothetical protein